MALRNPILILLVLAAGVPAQTMPGLVGPVQPPALTALNNAFRAAYAEAKTRLLASSGPTLIVNGDLFSLLRDGRRVEANTGTPIYDPVKTIAHIPLAGKPPTIAACESLWDGYKRKIDAAKDKSPLEEKADAAFRRCYGEHFAAEKTAPAVTRQAQDLIERLAAH